MTKTTTILSALIIIAVAAFIGLTNTSLAQGDAVRLSWTYNTGKKPINLPPVIMGDKVLVAPENSPLIALKSADGTEAWHFAPDQGLQGRSIATDGERVFVCLKDSKITALNGADGSVVWETDLGINCHRSPLVSDGTLFVPTTLVGSGMTTDTYTGAKVFAIDAMSGAIKWAFTSDNYFMQSPVSNDDALFVGGNFLDLSRPVEEGGHIRIYALDKTNGQPKWTYESDDGTPKALYATADRVAYIGYQDFVVGLDAATGEKIWRRDTGNWVPSLSGYGDTVYYGSATTKVFAWKTSDGTSEWTFDIPSGKFDYLMGAPVFEDGRMYFMSQKGTLYALNQKTGEEVWSHFIDALTRIGITVHNKTLYIGATNGTVSAYSVLK